LRTALADGERGTLYIDVLPDANNTTTGYGTIDLCKGNLAVNDTFQVDIVIDGANDLVGAYWILYYNPAVLRVTGYNWTSWKMGPGGLDNTDPMPDSDGAFAATYGGGFTSVNGDGVLLRVTLQAVAKGSSDLTLCTVTGDCPDAGDSLGVHHYYPAVLVDDPPGNVRVVVGAACGFVGGLAELPDVSGSSGWNYVAIAGLAAAAALVALTGGALYARRRWLR
jgi:hypothetical protein